MKRMQQINTDKISVIQVLCVFYARKSSKFLYLPYCL